MQKAYLPFSLQGLYLKYDLEIIIKCQPIFGHSAQTDTNSSRPATQSGPDSQTARPQARNSASGCNATPSLGQSTGFEV